MLTRTWRTQSNVEKLEKFLNNGNILFKKIGIINSGNPSVYYKNKLLKNRGWDSFTH